MRVLYVYIGLVGIDKGVGFLRDGVSTGKVLLFGKFYDLTKNDLKVKKSIY